MKKALRSLVVVAGLASATAFGSTLALADTPSGAPGQGPGQHEKGCRQGKGQHGQRFYKMLVKKLGLSEQQSAQAKTLFKDQRAQSKPMFVQMRNERHQLHRLIMSGTADEAAIRAQSAKVAAVQADLAVQRAKGAKQFMAMLTPEQQTKLKALQAQREERFGKSGGRGHKHGHDHGHDGGPDDGFDGGPEQ